MSSFDKNSFEMSDLDDKSYLESDKSDEIAREASKPFASPAQTPPKKSTLCFDIYMVILIISLFTVGLIVIFVANNWRANDPFEIAKIYHEKHPWIDGKNQLPFAIKNIFKGDVKNLKLTESRTSIATDLPAIRQGKLGGAVWSAYTPCGALVGNEGPAAIERTLYQIDIVHQLIEKYPRVFELAKHSEEVLEMFSESYIPSMISIDGGHQIHDDLSVLRMMKHLGVVSMSLTHECSTSWAQTENPYNTQYLDVVGLTDFGVEVIREMNRVGMIVDLSHTSVETMKIGLEVSEAPVIFSLSGAKHLCPSTLNVPNELFDSISQNGAVVMVPLFPPAICGWASDLYDLYRRGVITQSDLVSKYYNSNQTCNIENVFAHVDYLKSKLGPLHIGISTNFDMNLGLSIEGLARTSDLVKLTARFVKAGYSETDISRIIGKNYLKVWSSVEEKSKEIKNGK